jgi:hypothetical protein
MESSVSTKCPDCGADITRVGSVNIYGAASVAGFFDKEFGWNWYDFPRFDAVEGYMCAVCGCALDSMY